MLGVVWLITVLCVLFLFFIFLLFRRFGMLRRQYLLRIERECSRFQPTARDLQQTARDAFQCRLSIREQERARLTWLERQFLTLRDRIVYRGRMSWERIVELHRGATDEETYKAIIVSSQHPEHLGRL